MKSLILFCIGLMGLHNVFIVFSATEEAYENGFFLKYVDFSQLPPSQPDIIGTIQDCHSTAQCAMACMSHTEERFCQGFQRHESTGYCELLAPASKFSDKAKIIGKGWSAFWFQDAPLQPVECDEPWVVEFVNGRKEYVRYFDENDDGDVNGCLPVKIKIGTVFTFRGLRHRSGKTDMVQLREETVDGVAISLLVESYDTKLAIHNKYGAVTYDIPSPYTWDEPFTATMEYQAGRIIKVDEPYRNDFQCLYYPDEIAGFFKRGVVKEMRIR